MAINANPRLLNLGNNEVIEISKQKFSVGRSLKSDYVLNGSAISRIHFFIEKKDGIWTMQDNSTNGTYLNKVLLRSESRNLSQGDVIEFISGTVSLKFENPTLLTHESDSIPDLSDSSIFSEYFPSVSNDHSYDRQEAQTSSAGSSVAIDLTTVPDSPCRRRASKRNKTVEDGEIPVKKNKPVEESKEEPKCILEASELECCICQELFIKPVTLSCGHSFCQSCITKWKSQRNHCPICRRTIELVSPSMVLDNLVKKLVLVMDKETRERRDKTVAERPSEMNPPTTTSAETYSLSSSDPSDFEEVDDEEDEEDYDYSEFSDYSWGPWGEYEYDTTFFPEDYDFPEHYYY